MAYPYEIPEKRRQRTAAMRAWLKARGVAPGDEQVQADAYTACAALGVGMNELRSPLHRDYLLERLEVIMELGGYPGPYPRLSLGIGQRIASKAGYVVRFADLQSDRLVAIGERFAP
jgi:hypothetical protein